MADMSPIDRERVTSAIREAEKETSGEIYCVLAHASDGYFLASAFTVGCGVLIASAAAALAFEQWWISLRPLVYVAAQLSAYAVALAILYFAPGLRIHLVPKRMRYAKAHDNAVRQFLARNVHMTEARTGVLIFVSLAERYAEIVADSGINARVPQATWDETVAKLARDSSQNRLTDGYVTAIGAVGALLSQHFPHLPGDVNELDDHLVEI